MTELSFLIELLLNHKLPKETKECIAGRIKEIQLFSSNNQPWPNEVHTQIASPKSLGISQAPSTLAAMAKHGDIPPLPPTEPQGPIPVAVIAQTPATTAALQARQESIRQAMSGKPMPGETKPRKF